jgi:glycosyltransferase involved in cell wall biosynthesis
MGTYLFINSAKFWGGGEQWFLQCARELDRRGHRVTVAGRRGGVFLSRIAEAELDTLPLVLGADFSPQDMWRLRRWLIVHEPQAVLGNFTRDIRLIGRTVRWTQDVATPVYWITGSILLKQTRRHRRLVQRYVDRFIVPSQALKEEMLQFAYVDRAAVEVLPIGLDLRQWPAPRAAEIAATRESMDIPEGRVMVGVFARLESRKGHRTLLEAWKTVQNEFTDGALWVVGTGSAEAELRAFVAARGIARVKFVGFIKNVRKVMLACDLVVQPSLYEPFGMTLLEAMACAKPVLCTRVGGMPEVVVADETALIVPPDEAMQLAEGLRALLSNPVHRAELGAAGRRRVEEEFTLAVMVNRLEDILGRSTRSTRRAVGGHS